MVQVSGSATISYSADSETSTLFVGRTVGEVRRAQSDALNIPADAKPYVGRQLVDESYVIKPGDVVAFSRRLGEKGE